MCVYVCVCVCVLLFATLCTEARQAHLSLEFSRQEYCSGLPFTSPGYHPNPGVKPLSPTLQAESLLSEPLEKPLIISDTIINGIFSFLVIFGCAWLQYSGPLVAACGIEFPDQGSNPGLLRVGTESEPPNHQQSWSCSLDVIFE